MYPVLFEHGSIELHGYGLMVVLGFFCAVLLVRRKSLEAGLPPNRLVDAAFWAFISGLVGARMFFVASTWDSVTTTLTGALQFWNGGMVFYGGLIAGLITFVAAIRAMGLPVLKALDIAAPALAAAHVFGRIGCFLAGCCYGRACDAGFALAVTFNDPRSLAPKGTPLHPAQLYDAGNALLIFALLEFAGRRKKYDGQIAGAYLMLYAIGRALVETFRGDELRGFVAPGVSTSQAISLGVFVAGAALSFVAATRAPRSKLSRET